MLYFLGRSVVRSYVSVVRSYVRSYVPSFGRTFGPTFGRTFGRAPGTYRPIMFAAVTFRIELTYTVATFKWKSWNLLGVPPSPRKN